MTFKNITDALYHWLSAACTPWPVINYHQNAPQPNTENYVVFHARVLSNIAHDSLGRLVDEGMNIRRNIVGDRELVTYIMAKGSDETYNILRKAQNSLQMPSMLESLRKDGLIFVDIEMPITDVTESEQTRFIERYNMDVRFRLSEEYSELTSTIAHANIHAHIKNPVNQLVIDQTININ